MHPNIYRYSVSGVQHVVKLFNGGSAYDNELYVVEELNKRKNALPSELCIPDYLVETENGVDAFMMPFIQDSITLNCFLASSDFSHQEKIEYLKKVGNLLHKCDCIRKKWSMHTFAIGDIQEENILVAPSKKEIKVVDANSCRIGKSISSQAKYLTLNSVAMCSSKYRVNKLGYISSTRNSELFCYMMIILNY